MSSEPNWLDFFEDQERRYTEYYLDFAEQNARHDPEAYDQLETESGNLLKIAAWLSEHDEAEDILKLADALWQGSDFLHKRGFLQRGLPLLEQACQAARKMGNPRVEFIWLEASAYAHGSIGNLAVAQSMLEQALPLAKEINEPKFRAKAQLEMGRLQMEMGHPNRATTWLKQALQGYRQSQDYEGEINTLIVLGNLLSLQGDSEHAVSHLEHGLHLAHARQDRQSELSLRFALAYVGTATKNWKLAVKLHEPVVEMARQAGNRFLEIRALNNLGEAWLELGDIQQAISLLDEALALQETSDDIITKAFTHLYLAKAHNILNSPEVSLAHLEYVYPLSQVPASFHEAAEAAWVRADNFLKRNDIKQAQSALQDVLDLAPSHMISLRTAAETLLKSIGRELMPGQ
jgi:tetratricopeptide (TPR) repeat protein